jgi:hypothetical protein
VTAEVPEPQRLCSDGAIAPGEHQLKIIFKMIFFEASAALTFSACLYCRFRGASDFRSAHRTASSAHFAAGKSPDRLQRFP